MIFYMCSLLTFGTYQLMYQPLGMTKGLPWGENWYNFTYLSGNRLLEATNISCFFLICFKLIKLYKTVRFLHFKHTSTNNEIWQLARRSIYLHCAILKASVSVWLIVTNTSTFSSGIGLYSHLMNPLLSSEYFFQILPFSVMSSPCA